MESPVWAHKVERNGRASLAVMTNGAVTVPFVMRNGHAVELPHGRTRIDGASVIDSESLEMPRAHFLKARDMAAAILREQRPRKAP